MLLEDIFAKGYSDVPLQAPGNDQSVNKRVGKKDGQNEFNPDTKDNQEVHRNEGENAVSDTIESLDKLLLYVSVKDLTEPKFKKIEQQAQSLRDLLDLVDYSQTPIDTPLGTGSGSSDPAYMGGAN